MYDLAIIGGGPGGVAAAVYASRKALKTAIIYDAIGGQSIVSADIQNWIGVKSVSGFDFAKMLEEHLRSQKNGLDILDSDLAENVSREGAGFSIQTKKGKRIQAKTVLVISGSRRKRLGVPGEDQFDGKGVAYCSTCDAPLFQGKKVAVVGGGNAGLEAALDLVPYASEIYLLEYSEALKGDPQTQKKIEASGKVKTITMAKTLEIKGSRFVEALVYEDRRSGEKRELNVEGVFVEIGSTPNADFVKGLVELNKHGEIVADPKTQAASVPGVWAAGDVSDGLYKQNNISAGDAVKAVLNIYEYLNKSAF